MVGIIFENLFFKLQFDVHAGKLDLFEKTGKKSSIFFKHCTWGYRVARGDVIFVTDASYARSFLIKPYEDSIGRGSLVEIACTTKQDHLGMLLKIAFYEHDPAFLLELVLLNGTVEDAHVVEIYPAFMSSKSGSGLFFMNDPRKARVLEAGLAGIFDVNVRCVFGDEESDSDGNVLVYDLQRNRSFLCGVIERPSAMVGVVANENESVGLIDHMSGRRSFGDWKIRKSIVPFKCIHSGGVLSSNKVYFDIDPNKSPQEMLESYAEKLAKCLEIVPWPRHRSIPHGWNSYGNPTPTDPKDEKGKNLVLYIKDIDEHKVLTNFDVAYKKLVKFGLEYFQIDDGHQPEIGDWDHPDPAKFPRGLKPVFDTIHARGIKTGLWIRPFELSITSKTYKEHPNWALEFEGSFPIKSSKLLPLDVSRPEVKRWLLDIFTRFVRFYGVEWIKSDFTYTLIGGKGFQDADMTGIEAMQEGFKIIREAIGPATFLVGAGGPCVFHYGLVNAERFNLDISAAWGKDGPMMPIEQGIKPTVRVIARRYYLHNRIWFTHCDAIQFREPLNRNEVRVMATVIGLSGGVFKVAEPWFNLKDEHFGIVSRLLPIYRPRGRGMRPIDLMTKEYPECWDLLVDDMGNGLGAYHVVGLFNWGENNILGEMLPEEQRELKVNFKELGMDPSKLYITFEFWTSECKGEFKGFYTTTIKPRQVELIVFREKTGTPQFISSTRHVTQGAIDVISSKWDDVKNILAVTAKAVSDHEHRFDFYIPSTYKLKEATVNGLIAPTQVKTNGNLIVTVKNDIAPTLDIVLAFDR